jgi:superoxide dismutase, Cu-Zn family
MFKMNQKSKQTLLLSGLALTALLGYAACTTESKAEVAKTGSATLAPTGTLAARGTVTFTKVTGGVRVEAMLNGLPPGVHGFHVHQNGSCDSAGASAGGHFNPETHAHGLPDSAIHHMGDMGNITAGADSMAMLNVVFPYLTLDSVNTVVGHAIIVHAAADNGSQPTGAAGARISCGVVK